MLRPACPSDVDRLLGLQREYYREDDYPFSESSARSDPLLGHAWVIEVDGDAVGYLAVTLGYSFEYGGQDAFIDELFVLAAQRRRGWGEAALRVAEVACREFGVRALHLEVERETSPAQTLYRKWGFVDHRRHLMTKRLDTR